MGAMQCCVVRGEYDHEDLMVSTDIKELLDTEINQNCKYSQSSHPRPVIDSTGLKTREVANHDRKHKQRPLYLPPSIDETLIVGGQLKWREELKISLELLPRKFWFSTIGSAIIARYDVMIGITLIVILFSIASVIHSRRIKKLKERSEDHCIEGLRYGCRYRQPESEPSEEEFSKPGSRSSRDLDDRMKTLNDNDDEVTVSDTICSDSEIESTPIARDKDKVCLGGFEKLPYTYAEILNKVRQLKTEIDVLGLTPVYKYDIGPDGHFAEQVLLRFIVACEGDVKYALKMIKNYTTWRQDNYPRGIPVNEWISEMSGSQTGFLAFDMCTNEGQPVLVLRGKCRTKGRNLDDTRKLCVGVIDGLMEQARILKPRYIDPDTGEPYNFMGKYSCILDLGDFGYSNADFDGLMEVTKLLFKYFPECLGNVWVIHSNFIFAAMWSFIGAFLPKRNLSKYVFLRNEKEYKAFFPTIIAPEKLHKRYGGLKDDPPLNFCGDYRPKGMPLYL